MTDFVRCLDEARQRSGSLLCIGLDPQPERLPAHLGEGPEAIVAFHRAIIEATADLVCAYKPNLAFFEAMGRDGWAVLESTIRAIRALAPGIPVIADAKRGDIPTSAAGYAQAIFEHLGCDACTVSPYMGADSIAPFVEPGRYAFVLCHTSNPGSRDLQDVLVYQAHSTSITAEPLYRVVARQVCEWTSPDRCGLVVGATAPEMLSSIVSTAPDRQLLIPGVGTQGGDVTTVLAALGENGRRHAVVNVSRSLLFASSGRDFATAARDVALDLHAHLSAASPSGVVES